MKYHIKAHWKIDNERVNAEKKSQPVQAEKLEETLGSMPSPNVTLVECDLTAELPISLKAEVLRNLDSPQEVVRLISNQKQVDLIRGKDIGVSCDPEGNRVSVETINIDFRDTDDDLTDRGVVWVFPGNPASIHLVIKQKALETPGKITEIIKAAEKAVRNKVLAHFT